MGYFCPSCGNKISYKILVSTYVKCEVCNKNIRISNSLVLTGGVAVFSLGSLYKVDVDISTIALIFVGLVAVLVVAAKKFLVTESSGGGTRN